METADTISRLASDLEANPPLLLPSLQQLYRLGLVLFRVLQHNNNNPKEIQGNSVVSAYRELIESISDESLSGLFGDLQTATRRLLQSSSNDNVQDLTLAVRSMQGLMGAYSDSDSLSRNHTESTSRLCRVVYTSAWVSTLAALYDRFIVFEKQQSNNTKVESTKTEILSCLSRLVLDGLVLAEIEHTEESLLDAIRAMEEESTDCLRDLQAWQNREEPFRRNLQDSILAIGNSNSSNADEDEALERAQQREYIISMLESARAEPSSMAVPRSQDKPRTGQTSSATSTTTTTANNTNTSELDRRIQQVLQILPHFGEGFVEVALGLHQGDAESTVATLLNHPMDGSSSSNANYPTALRVLDPKLPRRKREFKAYQTQEEEAQSAQEARRDVKERMALEEKQRQDQYDALVVASSAATFQQQNQKEAEQASKDVSSSAAAAPLPDKKLTRKELRQQKLRQLRIRDEYDDDYDDQYDEIDIKLGAADDGFTSDNMTFEQVKLYNQAVQEDESDAAFWESNSNTNQKANSKNNNSNNGEKKWGPDKIKGGRVIGADGKIVRNPGGVKKKKTNNNRNNNNSGQNNNNQNGSNNNNSNNKGSGGKPKANNNNNNNGNNNGNSAANNGNKKKPKTKPRSDNRVNRQRDRKMKKQGAFGVQD